MKSSALTINSSRKHVDASHVPTLTAEVWIWKRDDDQPELLFKAGTNENALVDPDTAHGPRTAVRIVWDIVKAIVIFVSAVLLMLVVIIPLSLLGTGLLNSFIKLTINKVAKLLGMRTMSGIQNRIDPRRPILFLRAHDDDGLLVEKDFEYREPSWRHPLGFASQVLFEEMIASTFSRWGPLVSLGLPNERLHPFQVRRHAVPREYWQRQILYWMNRSSLIVLVLPPAKHLRERRFGVAWEIDTLIKMGFTDKLLVVIPPANVEESSSRWKAFVELAAQSGVPRIQESLPDPPPVLVHFTQKWDTTFIANKGTKPSDYVFAISQSVHDAGDKRLRIYQAGVVSIMFGLMFGGVVFFAWHLSLLNDPRIAIYAIGVTCIAATVGALAGYFGRLW